MHARPRLGALQAADHAEGEQLVELRGGPCSGLGLGLGLGLGVGLGLGMGLGLGLGLGLRLGLR